MVRSIVVRHGPFSFRTAKVTSGTSSEVLHEATAALLRNVLNLVRETYRQITPHYNNIADCDSNYSQHNTTQPTENWDRGSRHLAASDLIYWKVVSHMTTIDPMYATLPPLGEGIPLQLELRDAPPSSGMNMNVPTRSRAHLEEATNHQQGAIVASKASVSNLSSLATTHMSPPPTPPRLLSQSPVASRKSFGRMQSMDDSYCDRIRSTRWACDN